MYREHNMKIFIILVGKVDIETVVFDNVSILIHFSDTRHLQLFLLKKQCPYNVVVYSLID